jgi:hypothetical protein
VVLSNLHACREIQQLLVRLGDKPSSFVGSSNWVGAIELSYVLDEYLGVVSKILTVNRWVVGWMRSAQTDAPSCN